MPAAMGGAREELRALGRGLRERCPRSAHAEWAPPGDRADPLALLEESDHTRLPDLVPVRHARMLDSPFAFYRGAPLIMASDLSRTPTTGVNIQICGDAHLLNFGTYATPERNLVFDLNDFDETHVGPWEWDVKRLAASIVIAARTSGLGDVPAVTAVRRACAEYRSTMAGLAELSPFEVWHSHIDVGAIVAAAPTARAQSDVAKVAAKAMRRTNLHAFEKLTTVVDGKRVIVEDPPLVCRLPLEEVGQPHRFAKAYLATLDPDRRVLLDRYEIADAARKVVGVGSVGTRCFIVLLAGKVDLDPLFLQIKEAQPSVVSRFVTPSHNRNQGERVVVGQRVMQASSDVFLGWAGVDGFDFYVRQLRDMKWSADMTNSDTNTLTDYGRLCAAALARAHARAGEPALLAGYLGRGPTFDEALARFAVAYAEQNQRDYEVFAGSVESGRFATSG